MYINAIHPDPMPHTQVWLTVQGCNFGVHHEATVTDIICFVLKIISLLLLDTIDNSETEHNKP
jgi:hypothetical protein